MTGVKMSYERTPAYKAVVDDRFNRFFRATLFGTIRTMELEGYDLSTFLSRYMGNLAIGMNEYALKVAEMLRRNGLRDHKSMARHLKFTVGNGEHEEMFMNKLKTTNGCLDTAVGEDFAHMLVERWPSDERVLIDAYKLVSGDESTGPGQERALEFLYGIGVSDIDPLSNQIEKIRRNRTSP